LPFSLQYIGADSNNISELDRATIDGILITIGYCAVMLANPASFVRTLDLSEAIYTGGTGEGAFFNNSLQTIITTITNAGWTINLPFGGAVAAPYIAVGTFPLYTDINGTYYSQQNGFLYYTQFTAWPAVTSIDDMTLIESISTFPLNSFFDPAYFTKGSDESYYYYTPA
jgi:hypothetical protein